MSINDWTLDALKPMTVTQIIATTPEAQALLSEIAREGNTMKISESTAREVLAAIESGPVDERECFWALRRACGAVLDAPKPKPAKKVEAEASPS